MTLREKQVVLAIQELTRLKGYPPTVREVGAAVGLKSSSSTMHILDILRRRDIVTWEVGRTRTLRVLKVI